MNTVSEYTFDRREKAAALWRKRARRVGKLSPLRFKKALKKIPRENVAARTELLRQRFFVRVDEFGKAMYPDIYNRPFNAYHDHVILSEKKYWRDRVREKRGLRRCVPAARGMGKTTICKLSVLHDLVYNLEGFIVIVASNTGDAQDWSKALRGMVERSNPMFERLYGKAKVSGGVERFRVSYPDFMTYRGMPLDEIPHYAPVAIASKSMGSQIRGINEMNIRPTRIVIDDAERPDKVMNPVIRDAQNKFINDDVLQCGPQEGGLNVDWNGTTLHPDAILMRIKHGEPPNAGWDYKQFPAVYEWPTNSRLWEACGAIYRDKTLGDVAAREDAARAFYMENREAMDEGAVVLDNNSLPIFSVYMLIWTRGMGTVLREFQHDPRDPDSSVFDSSTFTTFRLEPFRDTYKIITSDGRVVLASDCTSVIDWDPATGSKDGDFPVLMVMLRDRHGYKYVVDYWMQKRPMTAQLNAAFALSEKWGQHTVYYENNGTLGAIDAVMEAAKEKRLERGAYAAMRLVPRTSSKNKVARISETEMPISDGTISFVDTLDKEAKQQYDDFPARSARDDFPDLVAACNARLSVRSAHFVQGGLPGHVYGD